VAVPRTPGGAIHAWRRYEPEPESDRQNERRDERNKLLHDLGSQLTLGDRVPERPARLPVGHPTVDRLLGGGFPLGALSEICGASSSGRTSLALSLLAATTTKGELAGWVDGANAFDPPSAERLGVNLDQVLWVRAPGWREALRATERLIQTEGFPLVLLDWTSSRKVPSTPSWIRLTRLAAATRTALLVLSTSRLTGPHAELALEMQPARARFTGTPALLEELETRIVLVRNRAAAVDPANSFSVELGRSSSPSPPLSPLSPLSPSSPLSPRPSLTPPHESAA
jgi:hypothetical protein